MAKWGDFSVGCARCVVAAHLATSRAAQMRTTNPRARLEVVAELSSHAPQGRSRAPGKHWQDVRCTHFAQPSLLRLGQGQDGGGEVARGRRGATPWAKRYPGLRSAALGPARCPCIHSAQVCKPSTRANVTITIKFCEDSSCAAGSVVRL